MPEQPQTLSKVVPVLVAVLTCEVGHTDIKSNKKTLVGVFNSLTLSAFPAKQRFSVYLKLTNADGYYDIRVRFVQVSSQEVLVEAAIQMTSQNRLGSVDFVFPNEIEYPFPQAGRYEFQVWANEAFLGSSFIDVQRPEGHHA